MFGLLFNQKIKVMKNLKQNLVKAILCVGVVSVSLIACDSNQVDDTNVISLDQLDDVMADLDSAVNDVDTVAGDTVMYEPVDDTVPVEESVEKNEE